MNIIRKIFSTPRTVMARDSFTDDGGLLATGGEIRRLGRRLFKGSLAIRVVTAGSTNACEQELVALGNSYYDVERFGVRFVASPRHADMLLVTGPVTRNMRDALITTYNAMPEPKIVVTLGDDAIDGGVFRGSYAVLDGVAGIIPVDYSIPGDPPSPAQIIGALLTILRDLDGGGSVAAAPNGSAE
ncbi:MAG: NADH-quinone oxidoreductase subunit B family protein [Thermoleophilia bacterium]